MSDSYKGLDANADLVVENLQLREQLTRALDLAEKIQGDWRSDTSEMLALLTESRALTAERSRQYEELLVLYNQLAAIVEGRTKTAKAPTFLS